jgi:hypothetical protein
VLELPTTRMRFSDIVPSPEWSVFPLLRFRSAAKG